MNRRYISDLVESIRGGVDNYFTDTEIDELSSIIKLKVFGDDNLDGLKKLNHIEKELKKRKR